MKRKNVSTTLAVVALLALTGGLISSYAMGDAGEPGPTPGPVPTVIGIAAHGDSVTHDSFIYRIWSDGLVEKNRATSSSCGFENWCGWTVVADP